MNSEKIKILIVEDDMIIAANLALQLTNLGYEVTGIEPKGEEAIGHVRENMPDLVLMDIHLKGKLNGIETVKELKKISNLPVIYLTANNNQATFDSAKETFPKAFISKPFNKMELQRTIELVVAQMEEKLDVLQESESNDELKDRIFVRHNGQMLKILLNEIQYIEADRNYCILVTDKDRYTLTNTLKKMEEKLPKGYLYRVHRSYIVNILKLDVVAEHHLEINRKVIPISKVYKEVLLSRIQTI